MRFILIILASSWVTGAIADPGDSVSGHWRGTDPDGGGYIDVNFSCSGTPTCTGVASGTMQDGGCLNSNPIPPETITLQGLDLSKPGTLSLAMILGNDFRDNQPNPANPIVCIYTPRGTSLTLSFGGSWSGSTGDFNGIVTTPQGTPGIVSAGNFTARLVGASPVFPMTVNQSVTPTTTNASATIQPRSQDVGVNASVYVFAHAPSNLVIGASPTKHVDGLPPIPAKPEDNAIVCVLAQVNSSGQLVAVSASTMQAYLTGVLSSQSQAVQILNNVQTSNVAGAAVYVGYGSSAAAMLSSGIYQTAISVPGGVQCTASLASAPAPESPGALTGLWWNANESGWGIHFTQREADVFAAWYTYDAAGNPKWYVAPQCVGMTGTSGTCTGSLYEVNGPTFFGASFNPSLVNVVTAGSLKLTFQDANNGSLTYTVGTQSRTVPITRQAVGVGTLTPAIDYTDLWYNASESGWGMAMAQQNANIFLAWYVYDATGKPVWYVASNCTVSGSSCSGALYSTKGPPFGPTFPPNQIQVSTAGSVIVSFIDANNAVLSYTVGSVTTFKTITRQLF
ncbi:MAG: hypothetical protein WA190_08550 [Usitatibacter sp.]